MVGAIALRAEAVERRVADKDSDAVDFMIGWSTVNIVSVRTTVLVFGEERMDWERGRRMSQKIFLSKGNVRPVIRSSIILKRLRIT